MNVPVQGYRAQVEYARRWAHDVEGNPGVAESRPEHPVAEEVVNPGERHHQGGHEEVGDGQRGQEEVADPAQSSVRVDRHADEDVAGDGEEYQKGEEDAWKMLGVAESVCRLNSKNKKELMKVIVGYKKKLDRVFDRYFTSLNTVCFQMQNCHIHMNTHFAYISKVDVT